MANGNRGGSVHSHSTAAVSVSPGPIYCGVGTAPPQCPYCSGGQGQTRSCQQNHPDAFRYLLMEFSTPESDVTPGLPNEVKNPISEITLKALTIYIVRDPE